MRSQRNQSLRGEPMPRARRAPATLAVVMILAVVAVLPAQPSGAATWPVYDVNNDGSRGAANRNMLQGFGDGSNNSAFVKGIHEGIDILANGQGGQEVAVIRGGTVIERSNDAGGTIAIRVNVGTVANPVYETDSYLHVNLTTAVGVDGNIAEGAKLGNISTTAFAANSRHLHYDVMSGVRTTNGGATPGGIETQRVSPNALLNPFARFTAAADRDPGGNLPALADTNADGRSIVITRTGTLNPITTKTVGGGVDLIADIRDNMNPNFLGASGVNRAGYYVKALFDQGVPKHDVGTAAFPYILVRFDDNFFRNNGNALPADLSTSIYATTAPYLVTTDNTKPGFNNTIFPLTRNYIVTNTTSNSGAVDKIDKDQFWNTNATEDNTVSDGSSKANFAFSNQTATKNAEARFRDGDYEIHILAGDLTHDLQDLVAGKVRLNNFAQSALPGINGAPALAAGNLAPLSTSLTPFLTGYNPTDPEMAAPAFTFTLGDTVAVQGDQFYPNLEMPVYIAPHRASWTEGLSFANAGAQLVGDVLSDANGFVSLTNTNYAANLAGAFDMIIDYDRSDVFSATLDALTEFIVLPGVVPEPATWLLLATGCLGLLAYSRWRQRAV
jgi:hypothetical protein